MEWNGDQPFFEGRTEDWTGGGGGTAIPYQHQKTDGNGKLRALRRPAKRDANHKNLMKLQVIETMKILREV